MSKSSARIIERKQVRCDMRRPAVLRFADHLHPCFVIDISADGSRLMIGQAKLPELFELLLTVNGAVKRNCKLVWQRGEECGVEFVRVRGAAQAETA